VTDHPDPYWKLRHPSAPSESESCKCSGRPPVVLQGHLSPNPFVCLQCNGEVPPEQIGFSAALAEQVASWRQVHDAIYTLWLDSSDYESWARTQLEDPSGEVNVRGLSLVQDLNTLRRTYYWWFRDTSGIKFVPFSNCPRCQDVLVNRTGHLVCETCSILVPTG
jgi:hypothetical protein